MGGFRNNGSESSAYTLLTPSNSPYTVISTDRYLHCSGTGTLTINLPTVASHDERQLVITHNGDGGLTVIVDGSGAETVGGDATNSLTAKGAIELHGVTGVGWIDTSATGADSAGSPVDEWYSLGAWDFRDVDTLSLSTDGTFTLQKGGIDFLEVDAHSTGSISLGTIEAATGGITFTAPSQSSNGSKSIGWEALETLVGVGPTAMTAADWRGRFAIQSLIDSASIDGGTSVLCPAHLTDDWGSVIAANPSWGSIVTRHSGTEHRLGSRRYTTSASEVDLGSAFTSSTSYLVTTILEGGTLLGCELVAGATDFSSPTDNYYLGSWHGLSQGDWPLIFDTPGVGASIIRRGTNACSYRLLETRLLKYGVAP